MDECVKFMPGRQVGICVVIWLNSGSDWKVPNVTVIDMSNMDAYKFQFDELMQNLDPTRFSSC